MNVVSNSNLVSLETEKRITACNFQTMVMNFFVIPQDLMRLNRKLCIYVNMKLFVVILKFHDDKL